MPFVTRSIGSGTPMRPVEQTSTSVVLRSRSEAVDAAIPSAFLSPSFPVQAFALPLFRMTARLRPAFKCEAETSTGAAFTLFVVKVAAEWDGASEKTTAISSRVISPFLIPHPVAPARNPAGAQTPPFIFLISLIANQPFRRARPSG